MSAGSPGSTSCVAAGTRRRLPLRLRPAGTRRHRPAPGADRGAQGDLASVLRKSRPGVRLNEHLAHDCGLTVFQHACQLGCEGIVSKRLGSRYRSGRSPDWLKFKNPAAPAVRREAEESWGRRWWGTLKYPINPAFDRYQAEAVLIGRILSSFGEIELTFCAGADAATEADKKLLKALYLLRTTSSRIDVADELMRPIYEQHRLLEPYTVTQTMVRYSLTIRNQYAHCNWADHPTAGLFFADLQTSAKNRSFDHFYKHVDIPLLTLQLEYLGATLQSDSSHGRRVNG